MLMLNTTREPGARRLSQQTYIYRWDRHGRKGQRCLVVARGKMNSCLVKFEVDGYTMVTSHNALKLANVEGRAAEGSERRRSGVR
jgi:hypothetical protein